VTPGEVRVAGRPRPFYGWFVVAGAFTVMFVGFGTFYAFAAFFSPLQREFAATRGELSLLFALGGFLYFSLGAASGPLADRFGPRPLIVGGMLILSVGLLLASQAQALWQVYVADGLGIGLGIGLAYVPAIGAVQRWFARLRGFASGLAVAGIGVGTLAVPPLVARLIAVSSWRVAYVALGLLVATLGCGAALLVEHSPQRRGLLPDGDTQPADNQTGAGSARDARQADEPTLRAALRSRPFWLLYAAAFATSLGLFIPFVHLVPYARDHGLSEATGVVLVGLVGVGSTVGRFVLGSWADRLGRRRALAGMFAGLAAILLWWRWATSVWSLVVFVLVFGACYGGFVALVPALTADYFGGRNVSGIIGVLYTSVAVGTLVGPTLAGVAYDLRHSYTLPIVASAAVNLIAVACAVVLPDPADWPPGTS
jgi:OFA family oxalate/formate antiporter-like MFS transporter